MVYLKSALLIIVCILLQACAASRTSVNLNEGKASFQGGDFKTSFHQLLPLAADGNPDAEYAVGYMYYYGYGTPVDSESGMFWMKRAADQGNMPAKKALGMIHSK